MKGPSLDLELILKTNFTKQLITVAQAQGFIMKNKVMGDGVPGYSIKGRRKD